MCVCVGGGGVYAGTRKPFTLYQTTISLILQPYSRLGTKNPYSSYFLQGNFITIVVQHTLTKPIPYKVISMFQFHITPGRKPLFYIKLFIHWPLFRQIIPYFRPNLSDFYTHPKLNCLQTIPFIATHTHIAHI